MAWTKQITVRYEKCGEWIGHQYAEDSGELADFWYLKQQRIAYYGLRACAEAASIRQQIPAGHADMSANIDQFNYIVEKCKRLFEKLGEGINAIPELLNQFKGETPTQSLTTVGQ